MAAIPGVRNGERRRVIRRVRVLGARARTRCRGAGSLHHLALIAVVAGTSGVVLSGGLRDGAKRSANALGCALGVSTGVGGRCGETGVPERNRAERGGRLGLPERASLEEHGTREATAGLEKPGGGIVLVNGKEDELTLGAVNCTGFNRSDCYYLTLDNKRWELVRDDSGEFATDADGNFMIAGKPSFDADGNLVWQFPDGHEGGVVRPGDLGGDGASAGLALVNAEGEVRDSFADARDSATNRAYDAAYNRELEWTDAHRELFALGWTVQAHEHREDVPDILFWEQRRLQVDFQIRASNEKTGQYFTSADIRDRLARGEVVQGVFRNGKALPRSLTEAYLAGVLYDGRPNLDDSIGSLAPELVSERRSRRPGMKFGGGERIASHRVFHSGDGRLDDGDQVRVAMERGDRLTVQVWEDAERSPRDNQIRYRAAEQHTSDMFLAGVFLGSRGVEVDEIEGRISLPEEDGGGDARLQDWNTYVSGALDRGEPVSFPPDPDQGGADAFYRNARRLARSDMPSEDSEGDSSGAAPKLAPGAASPGGVTNPPPVALPHERRPSPSREGSHRVATTEPSRARTGSSVLSEPPRLPVARPGPDEGIVETVRDDGARDVEPDPAAASERPAQVRNTGPTFTNQNKEGRATNAEQTEVIRSGSEPAVVVENTDIGFGEVVTGVVSFFQDLFRPDSRRTRHGEVPFEERGTHENSPCISPRGCDD